MDGPHSKNPSPHFVGVSRLTVKQTYKPWCDASFNDGKEHVQMFLPFPVFLSFLSFSASAFFYGNS